MPAVVADCAVFSSVMFAAARAKTSGWRGARAAGEAGPGPARPAGGAGRGGSGSAGGSPPLGLAPGPLLKGGGAVGASRLGRCPLPPAAGCRAPRPIPEPRAPPSADRTGPVRLRCEHRTFFSGSSFSVHFFPSQSLAYKLFMLLV